MRQRIYHAAASLMLAASFPAAAQDETALRLPPAGGWTADFADESCALRRAFSNGDDTVAFEMRQFAPGNEVEVAVASATLDTRSKTPRTGFLPGGELATHAFYRPFKTGDGREGVAVSDKMMLPAESAAAARAGEGFIWPAADRDRREQEITGYFVGERFDKDFILATGSLHEPMKVMRTCLDDLLTRWGLDAAAQRDLTRRATTDYDPSWLRPIARIQVRMMRNSTIGSVRARLIIDEGGKATDCKLLDVGVDEDLAAEFCAEVIKRAEFEPALDANSQPIRSYFLWNLTLVFRAA